MFRMAETRNEGESSPEADVAPEVWTSTIFIPLVGGGLLECADGQFTLTISGDSARGRHSHPTAHDVTGSLHGHANRRIIILEETDGGEHTYRGHLIPGSPDRFIGRRMGPFDGDCSARAIAGNAIDQAEAIWVGTKTG
jgi:hypothetical protein